ncbi:MAG: hypothetical protein GX567_08565 [Clostridia bacterium]|nr:hypothetical protein [Clostridia bacterium]
MLSVHDANSVTRIIHDINNPLSVIYSSLYVIQMQHPEVTDFKYWKETMHDLEELRKILHEHPYASSRLKEKS